MKALALALLALVVAGGLASRLARGDARWLDASEATSTASRWLFDESDACYHLRRIELALDEARVPERDAWLDHPYGGDAPWLPMHDTVLAGWAGRFLAEPGGPAELSGVTEERLERVVARSPVAFGALAAIATWLAARAMRKKREEATWTLRDEWPALLAAAVVAFAPAAIEAGVPSHVDGAAWCALLAALALWATALALRADAWLETLLAALCAGLATGLLCASFLPGILFFGAACAGFAARAWSLSGDERRPALRAGLLFCFVTAFAGQLPLGADIEHGAGPGELAQAWEAVTRLAMLAALPFLVAFALESKQSGRWFRTSALAVALAMLVWAAPGLASELGSRLSAYARTKPVLETLSPGARSIATTDPRAWLALSPLVLALPWCAWSVVRRLRSEGSLAAFDLVLVLATAVGVALCVVERRFASIAVVPMALLLARGAELLEERAPSFARKAAPAIAAVLLAFGVVLGLEPTSDGSARARRTAGLALVDGMRWMRRETELASAWDAPSRPAQWGVLAPPSAAGAILYHARRAAVATPYGLPSDVEHLRDAMQALYGRDPARLARTMRGTTTRYLVIGPRLAADGLATARVLGVAAEGDAHATLAARLSAATGSEAPLAEAGFVLAWRSPVAIEAELDGRALSGAAVSIYALSDAVPASSQPELRAR